eukprot:6795188-Alexandrium_andersonii.AAC.1
MMEKGERMDAPAPMLVSAMSEAAGASEMGERAKSDLGWLLKFRKSKLSRAVPPDSRPCEADCCQRWPCLDGDGRVPQGLEGPAQLGWAWQENS